MLYILIYLNFNPKAMVYLSSLVLFEVSLTQIQAMFDLLPVYTFVLKFHINEIIKYSDLFHLLYFLIFQLWLTSTIILVSPVQMVVRHAQNL